jgi:hypothetical protein
MARQVPVIAAATSAPTISSQSRRENKALKEVSRKDGNRVSRKWIEVGEWATDAPW